MSSQFESVNPNNLHFGSQLPNHWVRTPCFFLAAILCGSSIHAVAEDAHYEQRKIYKQTVAKLRAGQSSSLSAAKKQLKDYILSPYLDYHYLRGRVSSVSPKSVTTFLDEHGDIPASKILRARWLKNLGRNRQWQTLLQYYPGNGDAELNCYYLRALYGTGEKENALAATADAWIKHDSQPKACDPLFDVWQSSEYFNDSIVWRRLNLALQHNEVTLARYLQRYFSQDAKANLPSPRATAEAFYQAHVSPTRISRTANFMHRTDRYKTVIAHGLSRLLRRSPEKAAKAWQTYRSWDYWSPAEQAALDLEVAIGIAKEGQFPPHVQRTQFKDAARFVEFADYAVKNQNWPEVVDWIDRLPLTLRQEPRWQYWLARALQATNPDNERAKLTYRALAEQRQYYGFLAAQRLGIPGTMNAHVSQTGQLNINRMRSVPALQRSLELKAIGDDLNSRREWFAELTRLPSQQQILAAELAHEHGLLSLGILTANEANAHDHLHLRFPVGFEPQFRQAALTSGLPAATLVALARQESAMNHQARSHADAYGLMQLLPSTAKLVARRHGRTFSGTRSLFDAGINIDLGSNHLAWLVNRYDGQTPLAYAAYNAGEHRVDRWIKDQSGLPIDIWIELIPFRETRNYVKNVLAFRHVYAARLGMSLPMLSRVEAQVRER
ncbi:MAG: transglycosylase SLT domain-containing protein [Pseudomonadales bacterium]|nr:transglycosylase SLT domain-containing protein [Pseudomonadales bacterium]